MTRKEAREEMARNLILSSDGGYFKELSYRDLMVLYDVDQGDEDQPVPYSEGPARDQARRILGEEESTKLSIESLRRSKL